MNKSIGLLLMLYGLLLAGGGYFTHQMAPEFARPALLAGLIGGGLCLVWGLAAVAGRRGKALPLLTLIPVCFTLLSQAVHAWAGECAATPAALVTVLLALSVGMLMRIAYAGAVFDGVPAGSPPARPLASAPGSAKRPV